MSCNPDFAELRAEMRPGAWDIRVGLSLMVASTCQLPLLCFTISVHSASRRERRPCCAKLMLGSTHPWESFRGCRHPFCASRKCRIQLWRLQAISCSRLAIYILVFTPMLSFFHHHLQIFGCSLAMLSTSTPADRLRETFMVVIDGLLLPTSEFHRRSFMAPRLDIKTVLFDFGGASPLHRHSRDASSAGSTTLPSSHHFVTSGFIGSLSYTVALDIDRTRHNLLDDLVLGHVMASILLRSSTRVPLGWSLPPARGRVDPAGAAGHVRVVFALRAPPGRVHPGLGSVGHRRGLPLVQGRLSIAGSAFQSG